LVCLTSFAISLTLGGGPRASTIELSIYQSLRFDFDLGRAAMLSAIQFVLCAMATFLALRVTKDAGFGAGLARSSAVFAPSGARKVLDFLVIVLAAGFLLVPLLAAMLRGLNGLTELPSSIWPALGRSISVSVVSAVLSMSAASVLAIAVARTKHKGIELAAMLPLAASGLVLGTGLFILLRPFAAPSALALPITVVANTALTLPFLYRLLLPQAKQIVENYARLSAALDLTGWAEMRLIILPLLARQLGYGAGLAAALSMGDLGVIALFADSNSATLPLLVQQLMGAYRMDQAAAAALVLVIASAALFFSLDRIGKYYADA
jgi:thiamine transport system permease protein